MDEEKYLIPSISYALVQYRRAYIRTQKKDTYVLNLNQRYLSRASKLIGWGGVVYVPLKHVGVEIQMRRRCQLFRRDLGYTLGAVQSRMRT